MPEINKIEVRSEEVQELMGFIPNRIIRWGLTLIFLIFFGITVGCIFFKSPEIISAPIVLTTKNPPVALLSKSTGKIDRLFVQDGRGVEEGTVIALINNPTNFADFQILKEQLRINSNKAWDNLVGFDLADNLTLGELQSSYSAFLKIRNNFRHYLNQNLLPKKIELLKKQIAKQKEFYQLQLKQREILKIDLGLSKKSLFRDSILFKKGSISENDYEKAQQSLLSKNSSSAGFEASLKNTESSILQMQGNSFELQIQYEKELSQFRLDLDESKQNLDNLVHQWEERYLIKSPVKGIMTYTTIWSANQEVKTGDLIGTIIPQGRVYNYRQSSCSHKWVWES